MAESMIEALLIGRRKRWIGIIWGLLLVGLLVLPDVDSSISRYRELGEIRLQLALRADLPERARMLADRVVAKKAELGGVETALVPAGAISMFRQDVTQMVQQADCRLRSILPGSVARQPLDVVLGKVEKDARRSNKKPTWEVEGQTSSVSVQGSFANLVKFLSALDSDGRILHFDLLHVHAPPGSTEDLVLDMQIKTFNLFRSGPG